MKKEVTTATGKLGEKDMALVQELLSKVDQLGGDSSGGVRRELSEREIESFFDAVLRIAKAHIVEAEAERTFVACRGNKQPVADIREFGYL
jgi:hypothetical protein